MATSQLFFGSLPKISYQRPNTEANLSGGQASFIDVPVVDIFVRFKVKEAILNSSMLLYPYNWQENDRPDTVATQYYGSSEFYWVVFYSNGSFDLNYDFPLREDEFKNFLFQKYQAAAAIAYGGGWAALTMDQKFAAMYSYIATTVHSYQIQGKYVVDLNTYTNFVPGPNDPPSKIIHLLDHEVDVNEAKRKVTLIDNGFLKNVLRDYQNFVNQSNQERLLLKNTRN